MPDRKRSGPWLRTMPCRLCGGTGRLVSYVRALAHVSGTRAQQQPRARQPRGIAGRGTMTAADDRDIEAADTHPLRILHLDHVVLRVLDHDRMVAFYCDVLGCTIERVNTDLGLTQLRAGRSLIDLVPVDGPIGREGGAAPGAEGHNLEHFCLRIDGWDEARLRAWLLSHGVEAGRVRERYGEDGFGPSIYIRDPQGNRVELKGPPVRGRP
jgi:glyoxylase I family protein